MIEFGKTLRTAREAKGLTTAQVADATHMMIQIVEGLENEDFSRIVAPIYGRGFVKLYCETVGLEPKELIAEFMEIYNGNRPAAIRVRDVSPSEPREEKPVVAPPPPPPVATESAELTTRPVQTAAPQAETAPLFQSPSKPAEPPSVDPLLDFPPPEEEPRKPVKRAFHRPDMSLPELPPSLWRMAVVIGAFLIVLWLLFVGIRALYRATMLPPAEEEATSTETVRPPRETASPSQTPEGTPARQKSSRTPMPIPSLYID